MRAAFYAIMSENSQFWDGEKFQSTFRDALKFDESTFHDFESEFFKVADIGFDFESNMVVVAFDNYIPSKVCSAKITPFVKGE